MRLDKKFNPTNSKVENAWTIHLDGDFEIYIGFILEPVADHFWLYVDGQLDIEFDDSTIEEVIKYAEKHIIVLDGDPNPVVQ